MDNVFHIRDVVEVVMGFLQSQNSDDTNPAVTPLKGVICLCNRTIEEMFNEDSKKIK
jgi:hypothetical protein